jgi:hypothetical protein
MRRRLLQLFAAAALTAVVALLAIPVGGIWSHVTSPDLHAMYLPRFEAAASALFREGRLPLWNPFEYCGLPLLGTGQGAALYPPTLLCFALLPRFAALQVFYAVHLFLLSIGAILYWQREGVGLLASCVALLVVIAGLANGVLGQAVDHPSFLASIAWIPIVLVAAERALVGSPLPWTGVIALAVAAQWLIGYPEFLLDGFVLTTLVLVLTPLASIGRRVIVVAGGFLLGTALAAIQVFPLIEATGQSLRLDQAPLFHLFRAPPASLLAVLGSQYGFVAVVVAVIGISSPRRRFAWLAALSWALLALYPPFVWLYALPPFSRVRFTFAWSHLAPFFLGGFVAVALETIRKRTNVVLAAGVALALILPAAARVETGLRPTPLAFFPPYPYREIDARRALFDAARAQAAAPGRWLAHEGSQIGFPLTARVPFLTGWEPSLQPRRLIHLLVGVLGKGSPELADADLIADAIGRHAEFLGRVGVGYVVVPEPRSAELLQRGFRRIAAIPPDDVLLYREPVPAARVVHRIIVEADEARAIAALASGMHDPLSVAVVSEPLAEMASPSSPESSAARIVESRPERVVIETSTTGRGLLVLNDTYYPGWEASVDGSPTTIILTDVAFRGVVVEPGAHRVVFDYRPWSVRFGAAVSIAAGIVVGALLLVPATRFCSRRGTARGSIERQL